MSTEPVAVIGLGCRLPGARTPDELWALLRDGVDAIGEVPSDRWDIDAHFHADADHAGTMNTRWGGFIADAARFDAAFFNISAREAEEIDPQQRQLLEVTWHALEQAELRIADVEGSRTGAFIGISTNDWARDIDGLESITAHSGSGSASSIAANRLSFFFDLRGPSMAIDTACSSSLVAVHMACQSLRLGECNMAIAGGVNMMLRPDLSVALSRGRMLSPHGRCRTFDAGADGYVRGEGAAVVILKPLAQALADGNRVLAVIRGSAINQDGHSNGMTAPNQKAQESVIETAWAQAGADPVDAGYIELHGTGTVLGDPVEARALGTVVGRGRAGTCPVGSIKTNIGHLEAAAGIASLLKVILSLRNAAIPPSLHFEVPNPYIPFDALRLEIPTALKPWKGNGRPRLAGVSSFGFGGTNCHVVIEEAPAQVCVAERDERMPLFLPLSAKKPAGTRALAVAYAKRLADCDEAAARDVCRAAMARSAFANRMVFTATTAAELRARLEAFDGKSGIAPGRAPRVAFLCSGQASEYAGMAATLYARQPSFRAELDRCDAILGGRLARPLPDLLRQADLGTETAQPLLVALGVSLAAMWRAHGVVPSFVIGHSLGELTAACIAGAVTLEDALEFAFRRGELMALPEAAGAMASIGAGAGVVRDAIGQRDATVAACNGAASTVISGDRAVVAEIVAELAARQIRTRMLTSRVAFHSPRMDALLDSLAGAAERMTPMRPRIPLISTVDGEMHSDALPASHWRDQARHPVLFSRAIERLCREDEIFAIEIGPGAILTPLALRAGTLTAVPTLAANRDDTESFAAAVGELFVAGVSSIDWSVFAGPVRRGVSLPEYPFAGPEFPLRRGRNDHRRPVAVADAPSARSVEEPATAGSAERLRRILADVLHVDPAGVDDRALFAEMGADSLILVDAVRRIESEFSIRIPLHRLIEDLPDLRALAAFLDGSTVEVRQPEADVEAADPADRSISQRTGGELLWGTIETRPREQSEKQQEHLRSLTARYARRTPKSKEFAQRFRRPLADNRVAAGFRFTTKEMLYPIVGARGAGSRMWDVDENEYVDLTMGFGVHLFGHNPPFLRRAVDEQVAEGFQLGPQARLAGEVAELLCEMTGKERVAFCTSGTEANMLALRIARACTDRRRIVIFAGSYHGHSDGVLAAAVGGRTRPAAPGVTAGAVADVVVLDYGEERALDVMRGMAGELAAVLVEPVQSRRPDLQPLEFLRELRRITSEHGVLLIFDEVITGFRLHPAGAQGYFGIEADLATYGKVAGGGMPFGAVAGRADLMDSVDGGWWSFGDESYPRAETTFFASTFAKHPLSLAAARAVLLELGARTGALQTTLNERTASLIDRLTSSFERKGVDLRIARCSSLFRFVYSGNLDAFFYELVARGLYLWEGRNCFLSTAHDDTDLDHIVAVVGDATDALIESEFLKVPSKHRSLESPRSPESLPFPTTLAQRQLWTLAQVSPEGHCAYHVPLLIGIEGAVDRARLAEAFRSVVSRHEALRLTIAADGMTQCAPACDVEVRVENVSRFHDELEQERAIAVRVEDELHRPFNLGAPLVPRLLLFEKSGSKSALLFIGHHIAVDGLTVQIVMNEIAETYRALAEGAVPLLREPVQFREFVEIEKQREGSDRWIESRDFWRSKLAILPQDLEVAADGPRAAVRRFRGGRRRTEADWPALRAFALTQDCTPAMLLLAAYVLLLQRRSGQSDFLVGVPWSGRDIAGHDRLAGYCTSLLILRFSFGAGAFDLSRPFADFLLHVRETLLEAHAHRAYHAAQLIADLPIPRDPSRSPLVNATFNFDHVPHLPSLAGNACHIMTLPALPAKFELAFNATATEETLLLELEYDADLWQPASVDALLGRYREILLRGIAEPATPCATLSTTPDDVIQQRSLSENNRRRFGPALIHHRIDLQAGRTPDEIAVRDADRTMTFRELRRSANGLAARLISAGVGRNTLVALLLPRGVEMVQAIVAVLKAGGAYVPIDTASPPERTQRMLDAIGCSIAVTLTDAPHSLPASCTLLDVNGSEADDAPALAQDEDDLAYVIFTSGSSGTPKAVGVSHRSLVNYVDGAVAAMGLADCRAYAMVSTFAADLGTTMLFAPLCFGGCVHIVPDALLRDSERLGAWFDERKIDCLKIVPSHFSALLSSRDPYRLVPRKRLILGGESPDQVPLDLVPPACRVFDEYGPTETTVAVLFSEWDHAARSFGPTQVLPNCRIYLIDQTGQLAARGVAGELFIGGTCVASGYLGRADLTSERFVPDARKPGGRMYRTGDLGMMRADGRLIVIGRLDDQVKIRGFRVEPGEVATTLQRLDGIAAAYVVPRQGEAGQTQLIAYVVPDGGSNGGEQEVIDKARTQLPEHMLPSRVVFLDALPLTPNGKVDRAALPRADAAPPSLRAPASVAEETLLRIWRTTLGVADAGADDDFFAAGGDSIIAIQLAARAQRAGLAVEPPDIYHHPTAARLAALAVTRGRHPDMPPPALAEGDVPLTPIQQWFFERGLKAPHHWNLSLMFDASAPRQIVAQALDVVVAHHDAFRLRFARSGDGWKQWYAAAASCVLVDVESSDFNALQRSLDLTNGPLVTAGWIPAAGGESARLLFIAHHLIVDAVSLRIIVDDLRTVIEQISEGRPPDLGAKNAPFKTFASALNAKTVEPETDYWLLTAELPRVDLPGAGGDSPLAIETFTSSLGEAETTALLRSATASVEKVLLLALVEACAAWTGEPTLFVEIEGHGRDDVRTARSVGWFTTRYPVWLSLDERASVKEKLVSITEQLSSVPGSGAGYGLLRYFGPESVRKRLQSAGDPPIAFNYLGQLDDIAGRNSVLRVAMDATCGAQSDPQEVPARLISIDAAVIDGCLRLSWQYASPRISRETVEQLAGAYGNALGTLATNKPSQEIVPDARPVPPRDDIELRLSRIWQSTLDLPSVGVRDEFFDLGGHSLLAVKLVAKVQKEFGRNLPLAALFAARTVEAQASILRRDAPPNRSPLVEIKEGSARPLFLIHPTGGNVLCYAEIARVLSADQAVFGVQDLGPSNPDAPFETIEEMAARYLEAIRSVQPDGPYLLGGWSSGGVMAYEIAQQLRHHEETVALLALIDSHPPAGDQPPPTDEELVRSVVALLSFFAGRDVPATVDVRDPAAAIVELGAAANLFTPDGGENEARRLFDIFRRNVTAVRNYRALETPRRLHLLRATDPLPASLASASHAAPVVDETFGWSRLGPVRTFTVPGHHLNMLSRPHVSAAGERLQRLIDDANRIYGFGEKVSFAMMAH